MAECKPTDAVNAELDEVMEGLNDLGDMQRKVPKPTPGRYLDKSMLDHNGVIINFINLPMSENATCIGGIRLPFEGHISMFPSYLERQENVLKLHAIERLRDHMIRTQQPHGCAESLVPEDYSCSFTLATVTEEAMAVFGQGRREGPIFLCAYPSQLQPIQMQRHGELAVLMDPVHVVNCYVHLRDAPRRRRCVIKKHHQDLELAKKREEERKEVQPPEKKGKYQPTPEPTKTGWKSKADRRKSQQPLTTRDFISLMDESTQRLAEAAASAAISATKRDLKPEHFPPVKQTAPPVWSKSGLPALPPN